MTNTDLFIHNNFVQNKYHNLYFKIISNALSKTRSRSDITYYENHHIIPKSMKGCNDSINLVLLTAREHFICHYLLTKFTKGKSYHMMVHSAKMFGMNNKNHSRYTNSKLFESIKSIPQKMSESTKQKMSESSTGTKHSTESKQRMSKIKKSLRTKVATFTGYYLTPWGKFVSRKDSSDNNPNEYISGKSIQKWCKNSNTLISQAVFNQSKYLKSLPENPVGKTYSELGFGFEAI